MKQTLNLTKASTLSTVFSVQSILRNWEVSVSRHARLQELFLYVDTHKKKAEVCLWESYRGSSLIIWDTALIKKQMTNVVIKGHYKCFSLDS